ncbi:MAG: hypothetical protein EPN53_14680 [Acidobacteria bacterium]|nr:MAG: hypothetical protein EPN53_14680 [Acidobacteriota bacterium]
MKGAAASRFWVVRHVAGPRRAATPPDPDARAGVRPPVILELQWQGRGGRFRHIVITPVGLRRFVGTAGVVALLALAVGAAPLVRSSGFPRLFGLDPVVLENTELKARHEALRERAFDAAAQLDERIELGRRMLGMAATPAHAWENQSLRLPARDADDDAILAWISERDARLAAIGNELAAGRVGTGGERASVPAPAYTVPVPVRDATTPLVAGLGPAGPQEAAPTKR